MRYSLYPAFWVFILFAAYTASGQSIQLSFSSNPPSCNGYTNGNANVNPSGGTQPYTYQWNNGQTGQTNFGLGSGVYSVTVSDQNGQTASGSTTLGQPVAVTAAIGASGFNCRVNGVLTGLPGNGVAPYTYHWSTGANTASINVNAFGIYYLTVTDANGCGAVANKYVAPALLVDVIVQNIPCASLPNGGSAQAAVAGGVTPYTYSWNNFSNTQSIQNLSQGAYTVTVTDANGCTASDNGIVTQPSPLNATFTVNAPACGGNNGSATVQGIGGTAPYVYNWVSLGLTGPTQNNLAPGTYYVCIFDANNCQKDIEVVIPAVTGLNVSLILTKAECPGVDNGTATAIVNPPGNFNYAWNIQSGNFPQINGIPANTVVSVTVTDPATGCVGTATGVVGTHNQVHVSVTDVDVACVGDSTGSAIAVASSGAMPYSYVWTFPDSTLVNGPQITGLTVGAYLVVVTDVKGCTAAGVADISGAAGPQADFSVEPLNCDGDSIKMLFFDQSVDPTNSIISWHWVITRSDGSQIQFNQQNPPVLTLPYLETGTVQLTVTSANGCTDVTTGPFQVTGTPVVNVTLTTPGFTCENLSVPITVSGDQNYIYTWSPLTGLTPIPNSASVIADPDTTTTYTLLVMNGLCSDTFSVEVVRHDVLELSVLSDSIVTCDSLATLSASVNVANATIVWYNSSQDSIGNTPVIVVSAGPATFYTVVATDVFDCTKTDTVSVVGQAVAISLNISGPTFSCDNLPVLITVNGAPDNIYTWSPTTGLVFNPNATNVIADPDTTTIYQLIAQNALCADTVEVEIVRHIPINLSAGPDVFTCDSTATLTATVSTANTTFVWYNANGDSISNAPVLVVSAGGTNTYTVIATDAFDCTETDSVSVTGGTLDVTVSVDTSGSFCDNLPVSITVSGAAGTTYTWIPTTGLTFNPDALNVIANPAVTTIYQLAVQNGDCKDTIPVEIIRHIPIVVTAGPDLITCDSSAIITAIANAANVSFVWYNANGDSIANTAVLVVAVSGQMAIYSVVATDSLNCSVTDQINVLKGQIDVTVNFSTPGSFCDNLPVEITVTGTAGNTYSWFPLTDLTFNPDSANVIADPDVSTVYQLMAQNGVCSDTIPVEIQRHVPIGLTVSADTVKTCNPTAELTATVSVANATVKWVNSAGVTVHNGLTYTVSTATNETFTVIATDAFDCTETKTVTVLAILASIEVDAATPDSTCENTPFSIVINNLDPSDVLSYQWSTGGLVFTPPNTLSGPAGNYTVTVIATNQYECADTLNIPLTLTPKQNLDGMINIDLCRGKSVRFENTSGIPGTWNFGDGTAGSPLNPVTHNYAVDGTYIVFFTPDASVCANSFTDTISVLPEQAVKATATSTYIDCGVNALIQFTGNAVPLNPGLSWNWTFSAGTPNSSTQQSTSILFGEEGMVTATLIVTDQNHCADTTSIQALVQVINESIMGDTSVCMGQSVQLNPVAGSPNYQYAWVANPFDSTLIAGDPSPVVTPMDTTTYTLIITNGLCSAEFSTTVTPIPAATLEIDDHVVVACTDAPVTLHIKNSNATSFTWSNSPSFPNPPLGTDSTLVVSADPGVYYIMASIGTECVAIDSIVVRNEAFNLSGNNDTICVGSSANLNVITSDPDQQLTYEWVPALDPVPNPKPSPASSTSYQVIATNEFGCKDTASLYVHVREYVSVTAQVTGPDTLLLGDSTTLLATGSGATDIFYAWTPSGGLSNPFGAETSATVEETTVFTVTASADDRCPDTAQVTVVFREYICGEPFIFVPNAFTPNNDNNNDLFIVRGINISSLRFIVWDRWGEIVYETTDPQATGWDGTYRGKDATPDAYAWYLEVVCGNGGTYKAKGDVTLLK